MVVFDFSGELDDKMKWLKNFERLLEIQKNIVWPPITELDSKAYVPEFMKVIIFSLNIDCVDLLSIYLKFLLF